MLETRPHQFSRKKNYVVRRCFRISSVRNLGQARELALRLLFDGTRCFLFRILLSDEFYACVSFCFSIQIRLAFAYRQTFANRRKKKNQHTACFGSKCMCAFHYVLLLPPPQPSNTNQYYSACINFSYFTFFTVLTIRFLSSYPFFCFTFCLKHTTTRTEWIEIKKKEAK